MEWKRYFEELNWVAVTALATVGLLFVAFLTWVRPVPLPSIVIPADSGVPFLQTDARGQPDVRAQIRAARVDLHPGLLPLLDSVMRRGSLDRESEEWSTMRESVRKLASGSTWEGIIGNVGSAPADSVSVRIPGATAFYFRVDEREGFAELAGDWARLGTIRPESVLQFIAWSSFGYVPAEEYLRFVRVVHKTGSVERIAEYKPSFPDDIMGLRPPQQ